MKYLFTAVLVLFLSGCHHHHHVVVAPVAPVVPVVQKPPVPTLHTQKMDWRNSANGRARWYAPGMKRMDAYPSHLKLTIPAYGVHLWFHNNGTRVDLPGGWVVLQSRLQTPPDVRGLCIFGPKGTTKAAEAYLSW